MPQALFTTLSCGESVEAHDVREFTRLANPVYFRTGTTIFSEGERAHSTFGLSRGVVRLYKLLPDGRRQVVAFALPGDFLGIPFDDKYSLSADAIGEVALCRFSRDELTRFIRSRPQMMRGLIRFAGRQLDMAHDQLLLLGNSNSSAEERVAIFLITWRKRLSIPGTFSEPVPLPMRRQDIADFLGLRLETVSRTLTKLEQKNAVRVVPAGVFLTGLEHTPLVMGRNL